MEELDIVALPTQSATLDDMRAERLKRTSLEKANAKSLAKTVERGGVAPFSDTDSLSGASIGGSSAGGGGPRATAPSPQLSGLKRTLSCSSSSMDSSFTQVMHSSRRKPDRRHDLIANSMYDSGEEEDCQAPPKVKRSFGPRLSFARSVPWA